MNKLTKKYYEILGLDFPSLQDQMQMTSKIKVILEDKHKEVNIGQKALGYLKSKLKTDIIEKINIDELKDALLKSWVHYNDFCICYSGSSLWLLEIDFNKIKKATSLIKCIDPNFNLILNKPSENSNRPYGLTINLSNDRYVILIDTEAKKDELPLLHEFVHFVQYVTNKLKTSKDEQKVFAKMNEFFGIDNDAMKYITNQFEFWTNVYNDLFAGLQKTYWMRFSDAMTWEEYIESYVSDLKLNILNYEKSAVYTFWKKDFKSGLWQLDVLACISYFNLDLFDKIVNKLKNK